jgi:hypothetical protein
MSKNDEPNFRKHTLDEDQDCEWCSKPVRVLYQVPDSAPTGESDFVCFDCLTYTPDDSEEARWDALDNDEPETCVR